MKPTKKYTVVTGASSGIGRETAKAFANRGRNLIVAARRTENLEALKREVTEQHPTLDVVIRTVDLSVLENVYQFYSDLKDFQLETWVNNAGFGNKGNQYGAMWIPRTESGNGGFFGGVP